MELAKHFITNDCIFNKRLMVHIPKKKKHTKSTDLSTLKTHEDSYVSVERRILQKKLTSKKFVYLFRKQVFFLNMEARERKQRKPEKERDREK